MAERVYNFAAGPSTMPESALKTAAAEMLDYKGSGMSVMEISHRSPLFQEIFDSAQEKLRLLLHVPESHEILFLQGGATTQFAAIPMNLLEGGAADYAVTGNFSGKAAEEAAKYGTVRLAADTSATGHDRIPTQAELKLSPDAPGLSRRLRGADAARALRVRRRGGQHRTQRQLHARQRAGNGTARTAPRRRH